MSIRWRLTSRFALILAGILLLSGILLHILLQQYLFNQVDNNLRIYSAEVHGTLNLEKITENFEVIHSQLPAINEFVFPGIYIQILDNAGRVVVKSNSLGEQELPVDPSLISAGFDGDAVIGTIAAGDDARIRTMVSPLYLQNEVLLLEVAQSLNPIDGIMSQVRWAVLLSVILAMILSTITGAITVKGALSPVRQITRIARSIGASSDLSQRVSYNGPMDEIGELANTFDNMIEQLNQVFQSQKHFVGDASHELRGPLTVISGNLDLLKRKLNKEDRAESMRAIVDETARMTKIVEDLLLVAEIDSGQVERKEIVHLPDIIQDSLSNLRQVAGNQTIVIGSQEDVSVQGDSHKLNQAFRNLVANAVRYGGQDNTITLSLFRDGQWARLEVSDTGPGIGPEHLPFIFDRFYRVDKARSRVSGGTGLGLTIVKGIVEQQGGKVSVTSKPGKGSTFSIWLKL